MQGDEVPEWWSLVYFNKADQHVNVKGVYHGREEANLRRLERVGVPEPAQLYALPVEEA